MSALDRIPPHPARFLINGLERRPPIRRGDEQGTNKRAGSETGVPPSNGLVIDCRLETGSTLRPAFALTGKYLKRYIKSMRKGILIILSVLVVAGVCLFLSHNEGDIRFTEYELREGSFKAETLREIETDTGLILPNGAKGLRYHYKPPIDPIIFAKIEIPPEAKDLMEKRLTVMKEFPGTFHLEFANNICKWWPSSFTNEIRSKLSVRSAYYIQAHLVEENERIVLYLKYFTL